MTIQISGGGKAEPSDRDAAKAERALLTDELSRIRAGALAWRNGLGALLAGLIGFGLVKGRSDISTLDAAYAALAGYLLLASLIVGAASAVLMMRAAHGRPYATSLGETAVGPAADRVNAARRAEANASERALRWGVLLCLTCAALLTSAVGVTWYGPSADKPFVEVQLDNSTPRCGQIVSLSAGRLTLKTSLGLVTVDLTKADGIATTDTCPAPPG